MQKLQSTHLQPGYDYAQLTPPPMNPSSSPLSHLRHYANLSHLSTHKSIASNDSAARLPRQDASAQTSHAEAVRAEIEVLRGKIRHEREALEKVCVFSLLKQDSSFSLSFTNNPIVNKLPLPPTSASSSSSTAIKKVKLNDLLTLHHLYTTSLSTILPLPAEIYTPPPTSPLNPLLLHRFLADAITGLSTLIIPSLRSQTTKLKADIKSAEASLNDTLTLTTALRNRIETLENELHRNKHNGTNDEGDEEARDVEITENIITTLEEKYVMYNKAQRKFLRELAKFVNTYLSKMVAAEAEGGPVVGEDLEAEVGKRGFDTRGRPRRVKEKGQRGIDEMFDNQRKGRRKRGLER